MTDELREQLGRIVRETWISWAKEQPDIADHPHWLTEWDGLSERDKEVDRRIGEAIFHHILRGVSGDAKSLDLVLGDRENVLVYRRPLSDVITVEHMQDVPPPEHNDYFELTPRDMDQIVAWWIVTGRYGASS